MGNNGFANNEYDDTQILQENRKRKSLEIADKMIREAEASRAKIFKTPGNESNYIHTSLVDDNYMVIGAHVDLLTQDKIKKGEYVDFSKLLPKDRSYGEDQQMELVNRGGQSFFIPAEKDSGSITNFNKWEQAFRIYMNVYSRQHPSRASELIQYNHIIFTAASTYLWDNVYTYDKEFRMHMANYPNRNWSVILQQAWTMYLKDRIRHDNKNPNFGGSFKKHKEECKRLNRGTCTSGMSCKYDHHCLECGKFGHGAHICRRRSSNGGPKYSGNAMQVSSVEQAVQEPQSQINRAQNNNQNNSARK